MARSHLIALLLVSGCQGPPALSDAELRALVESRFGTEIPLECIWSPGFASDIGASIEETTPGHGRYIHGRVSIPTEPYECFEELERQGVLRTHDGLEFELAERARFDHSDREGVSVRWHCSAAPIRSVHPPLRWDGEEVGVSIELGEPTPHEPLRTPAERPTERLGCNGGLEQRGSCTAYLQHGEDGWRVTRATGICARILDA